MRINDFVVIDRNGNYDPKAKTLQLHSTVDEAALSGKRIFGKFQFQIISYTEFRRTFSYKKLMAKIQTLERLKEMQLNLKRNAPSQKHPGKGKTYSKQSL